MVTEFPVYLLVESSVMIRVVDHQGRLVLKDPACDTMIRRDMDDISPDSSGREGPKPPSFLVMQEYRTSFGLHDSVCLIHNDFKENIEIGFRGDDLPDLEELIVSPGLLSDLMVLFSSTYVPLSHHLLVIITLFTNYTYIFLSGKNFGIGDTPI